jgi:uncharacterized membrane protein YesL
MRIKHETFGTIFNTVYAAVMGNLLLIVGCAPLTLGLLITDPARSWPLLALVTPLCLPAVVGVFAVMAALRDGHPSVLATFARSWRESFKRATVLGAIAVGALVVLGVDLAWAWGGPGGAIAIPVLTVLMLLVASTTMLCLVTLAERPAVRLRDALRACLYLGLRRWYLTGVSLLVLLLLVQIIAARPAIGMGIAAAPLLYIVWANSRFSLRPALDKPEAQITRRRRPAAARA